MPWGGVSGAATGEPGSPGLHRDFRLFVALDPPPAPGPAALPAGLLQCALKVTHDPPCTLRAHAQAPPDPSL